MNTIGIAIKFEWPVYPAYEIEEEAPIPEGSISLLSGTRLGPKLVARGLPVMGRPLENFPALYTQLAALQPSPDSCLAFARKFGLLTDQTEEHLFLWRDMCRSMKQFIELLETKSNWEIQNGKYNPMLIKDAFDLQFEPDESSQNFVISALPRSLNSALHLQCLFHFSGGGRVRACKSCGNLMEIGGPAGKRSHVMFCSDKCRSSSHHRLNRPRKTQ